MAKRIFQAVIFFFAIYAFVFVPLGKKTGFEHVLAIAGTPAARQAASEVKGGVTRLVERLQSEARESTEETDRDLEDERKDAEEQTRTRALPKASKPPVLTPRRELPVRLPNHSPASARASRQGQLETFGAEFEQAIPPASAPARR
jgi:hypothetical protein